MSNIIYMPGCESSAESDKKAIERAIHDQRVSDAVFELNWILQRLNDVHEYDADVLYDAMKEFNLWDINSMTAKIRWKREMGYKV